MVLSRLSRSGAHSLHPLCIVPFSTMAGTETTPLSAAVIKLASEFSIETTPATAVKVKKSFASILRPGTTVNVTFLPGSDIADTISCCKRLREEGMNPVPHLAARSIRDATHLEDYVSSVVSEAKVEEVLIIGGGVSDSGAGAFTESLQIANSGVLQRYGIKRVGFGAHPEGSPDISQAELSRALVEKNAWAERHRDDGIECYLETQFGFDPDAILEWEREVRQAGNKLPIHLGVAGPTKLTSLIKFATASGVGNSLRVLTRQSKNIFKLATQSHAPDGLITGLAKGIVADPACLIQKLHYYSFGGFGATAKWAYKVADGQFEIESDGYSLKLE